jgi:hypothetical protein
VLSDSCFLQARSGDSSVGIVTASGLTIRGSSPGRDTRFFSSLNAALHLPINGYRG